MKRSVDNYSGRTEARRLNFLSTPALDGTGRSFEEVADQVLESGVVSSGKPALEDRTKGWSIFCEQPHAALCPTDIACQNHRRSMRLMDELIAR
jgi:hypothetical protein